MIGARTRTQVRQRARNCCEYCHLHQDDSPLAALHIEHIVPKIHGGTDSPDNLALACIDCNLHKGTKLTGIDPETGEVTGLFHPRRQNWDDHFERRGIQLTGRTAVGRTAVRVLRMNSEDQLALRCS
ncbi:MAG TPA: HNH endonuclease [Bryobacteraceae bacterium]|nr:HNH endonuclease [Bryobacteraceae bacterium]